MKPQKRFMKLLCLVLALTVILPAIPAQASTDNLETGYHASTTFTDENAAGKAFDDDPATRWAACGEQNQWLCAIFENEVTIDSVEINEFWDRMNSFEIQYLDENGAWQTCASKTIETEDTGIDTTHQLSFAPVRTTGMRLYIHDAPGWPSIYEFKMFYSGVQVKDGKLQEGYHASTTFGDEQVSKAFDNDSATRWSACAEQNQWICAIFGNEVVINSVEISEFWDRMNSFEIQYLDENGIWQTCASKTVVTEDTGIDTTHQLTFAPVKTTGMRLYIHDAPGWPSIYEFKMFYGEIQIMDGKSVVGYHASTTFGDENVSKAFDNDPNTRWSACAEQNQWICAIFEKEVTLDSVEINEFWDRMNSFEIQYLDENGLWQTCASKIIETEDTGIDTTHQLTFAPVRTTGMRLYIHDAPGWPSIYEFKMFYSGIQIVDGKLPVGYYASTTFVEENAVGKAFDNDPATRWAACAEQNQWICSIFENEVTIDSVEINEFWDRMNSFEIQYLDENGLWQTCASKTIEGPDTGIDTTHLLSFDDVTTTGIRLYIHDAPGWPSIYEFKMFNDRPAPIEYVAQVGEQSYATVAEAIANANSGAVKLLANSDEAITVSGDVTIDLAGCSLSNVTVSDGATLTLIDTATDDYTGEYGAATVTGTVATFAEVDSKTYVTVGENGVYSAHCYDVAITHISLNPAKDALGYKAQVYGDEIVQAHVEGIGFNLWVDGGQTKTYEKAASSITLRLQNILKCGGGEMNINATAFATLTVGEETHTKTSTQQTTTMMETLQKVNATWTDYTEAQQIAVKTLCNLYLDTVSGWGLTNIYPAENAA